MNVSAYFSARASVAKKVQSFYAIHSFSNLCREHKGEFSDEDILKQGASIEDRSI